MPVDQRQLSPDVVKRTTVEALVAEFGQVHDVGHIEETVAAAYAGVDGRARYREFVPLLTRRLARETLLRELEHRETSGYGQPTPTGRGGQR